MNLRSSWKFSRSVFLSIMLAVTLGLAASSLAGKGGGGGGGKPPKDDSPPADFDPEIVNIEVSVRGFKLIVADGTVTNTQVVLEDRTGPFPRDPSWSPDGTEVLFTQEVDGQWGIYRLPIFGADGKFSVGVPSRIIPVVYSGARPRWSPMPAPDGKYWIAYSDIDPNQPPLPDNLMSDRDLFLVNPDDGSNTIRLTSNQSRTEYHPTWSPNADRIGFLSLPNDKVCSCPGDVEIANLGVNAATETLEVSNSVSLVMNNPFVDGSGGLAEHFSGSHFRGTDWANNGEWILTNSPKAWVIPTTQEDMPLYANEIFDDPEITGAALAWSSNDEKILYSYAGEQCGIPKKVHTDVTFFGTLNWTPHQVTGVLVPTDVDVDNCVEEMVGGGGGSEWWRGGTR